MNRNANIITTVTMADGTEHVVKHRNSLMGWVNAMNRAGLNPREVVSTVQGLPESARVHR